MSANNNMEDLFCDRFCTDSHTVGKRAIRALKVGCALGLFSQTCSSNKFQSFSVRMTCVPVYLEHFPITFGKVKFGKFHVPAHALIHTHIHASYQYQSEWCITIQTLICQVEFAWAMQSGQVRPVRGNSRELMDAKVCMHPYGCVRESHYATLSWRTEQRSCDGEYPLNGSLDICHESIKGIQTNGRHLPREPVFLCQTLVTA